MGLRDIEWHDLQEGVEPAPCVAVSGDHPAYILYTSGTTGAPKGVVRPTAGHLVALNWTMKNIYNVDPGDVFWAASDVGWVVGHSYICYAPLIHGNTTVVFEGKPVGTPDATTFWRVIAEHDVRSFFTAPTAFRAIKRQDSKGDSIKNFDMSRLRALYLAGERADPDTIEWAQEVLGVPVYDHWWQTETGFTIAGNPAGIEAMPVKIGSPTVAMPGYDVQILDEDIAVEKKITINNLNKRFDVVVFDRNYNPLMIIECKSPSVKINQDVFDQIYIYNLKIRSKFLMITNGLNNLYFKIDEKNKSHIFVKEFPLL